MNNIGPTWKIGFILICMMYISNLSSIELPNNYLTYAETTETKYQCENIGGKWDSQHKVCWSLNDESKCEHIGGTYLIGVGREYACPLENPECGGFAAAPPVCIFSDSIKTKVTDNQSADVQNDSTLSSSPNLKEDGDSVQTYSSPSAFQSDDFTWIFLFISLLVICIGVVLFIKYGRR